MRVCVFCSSSAGAGPRLEGQAARLGRALASRGHELVYGGTAVGTMGSLAAAARQGGGRVTGVLPAFLRDRGIADEACDELMVTDDLLERKRLMLARADGFVALPGGLGTLDELLEVVTHVYLGQLEAPIVLLDADGFFAPLLAVLEDLERRGLARAPGELVSVREEVDEAITHLERTRGVPSAVWRA